MHSAQRRWERGKRAASASVLSGATGGTRVDACEGVAGRVGSGRRVLRGVNKKIKKRVWFSDKREVVHVVWRSGSHYRAHDCLG